MLRLMAPKPRLRVPVRRTMMSLWDGRHGITVEEIGHDDVVAVLRERVDEAGLGVSRCCCGKGDCKRAQLVVDEEVAKGVS